MNFLLKYKTISVHQRGFYPGRSIETGLYVITEYVYKTLNYNKFVGGVFFDLSRAFNSIELEWIMSYLHNRQMYARIRSSRSGEQVIETRVPQGSMLGPSIFLMCISDPLDVIGAICIADDMSIVIAAATEIDLYDKIRQVVIEMSQWCHTNRLILIKSNTDFVRFKHSRNKNQLPIIHSLPK